MGLFKQDINPRDVAIEWERQLDEERLKAFRKAIDLYRKGDAVLSGNSDGLTELIEEMENENDN